MPGSINKRMIVGLEHLDTVIDFLKQQFKICKVFTFTGPLGAGKTTLVRALLVSCGVAGPITSPTFTYVNTYKNDQGQLFHHFDLYRIGRLDDFLMAGFDEYLYAQDSWSFIEWPEVIMPLLKSQVCHVAIDYGESEDKRVIECSIVE